MSESFPANRKPKEESMRSMLQKEGIEAPPIQVRFYFHKHEDRADALEIKPHLKEVDIVSIEAAGVGREVARSLDKLSHNPPMSLKAYKEMGKKSGKSDDYFTALGETLYKKGVSVICPDLPSDHPLLKAFIDADEAIFKIYTTCVTEKLDFEAAVRLYEARNRDRGSAVAAREAYILDHIREEVGTVLRAKPELLKKENLRVLVLLGAVHTGVLHDMAKGGTPTEYEQRAPRVVHTHDNTALRSEILDKPLTREAAELGLIDRLPSPGAWNLIENVQSKYRSALTRVLVSLLSGDDRKTYYEKWMQKPELAGNFMMERLGEYGITRTMSPKRLEKIAAHFMATGKLPEPSLRIGKN